MVTVPGSLRSRGSGRAEFIGYGSGVRRRGAAAVPVAVVLGFDSSGPCFCSSSLNSAVGTQPGVERDPIALFKPFEDLNVRFVVFADLHLAAALICRPFRRRRRIRPCARRWPAPARRSTLSSSPTRTLASAVMPGLTSWA